MAKSRFCSLLDEGLADEAKAPPFYDKLQYECLLSGTSPVLCEKIIGISDQEKGHHRILVDLKKRRCLRR